MQDTAQKSDQTLLAIDEANYIRLDPYMSVLRERFAQEKAAGTTRCNTVSAYIREHVIRPFINPL